MRKSRLSRYKQHPDKTFIGKISKGFDFLGDHFNNHGLSLAKKGYDYTDTDDVISRVTHRGKFTVND